LGNFDGIAIASSGAMRKLVILSAIVLTALLASSRAQAANFSEDRRALVLGIGMGVGHVDCARSGCDGVTAAGGLNLHLGFMITPRVALVADAWGLQHMDGTTTIGHTIGTLGVQFWMTPRFWLQGGAGIARATFDYGRVDFDLDDTRETSPGVMAALGFELLRSSTFALDLQLRGGTGLFDDGDDGVRTMMLSLGANWY
jgi:hypothetical protein